jgi:hypothetical protein
MMEWKPIEGEEIDEAHCAVCRAAARLAGSLAIMKPQNAEDIRAVVDSVVSKLSAADRIEFARAYLQDAVYTRRQQHRRRNQNSLVPRAVRQAVVARVCRGPH